jgi:hypothetical protein
MAYYRKSSIVNLVRSLACIEADISPLCMRGKWQCEAGRQDGNSEIFFHVIPRKQSSGFGFD